ncbi:MAG: molybdopterin-dependent oxidoreductase [Myxococcota bacterium]|nr:molybdopterin-dependent oxidoreductase [Myxococcota bacterium]
MTGPTATHHTFCRICEALCGLEVDVRDGQITEIRPDANHVGTQGFACVKGIKQDRIYASPDRLTQPLKRVDDRYEPISWDTAFQEIGAKTKQLRTDHHPDSIAMYVGTAAGFSVLHPIFAQGFMTGLGSTSMYSSATQDCANKFAVARQFYGFPFTQPFPDIDRTECLIVVGANPAISKWSFLQVSNPVARLKDLSSRGGRLWVVDPRKTETARAAGEHVFIRPNTDVYFYLAFLNQVLERGEVATEHVAEYMTGYERLESIAGGWTPERVAPVTGMSPEVLRQMVDDYLSADGAALYCSTGVNMGQFGSTCFWLQEVINAITGNLDRKGGTLVGQGIFDFAKFGKRTGTLMRQAKSRVGGLPSVNDAFAGGLLADEILTPGERQVRALFVTGGNPLLTMPNSARLRRALQTLEMLVVVDIFQNETASVADYVLPATSPFQRPDLPFLFPLFLGMQSRPYLQATEEVLPPHGEQLDEASIYYALCKATGVGLFGSRLAQSLIGAAYVRNGRVNQRGVLNTLLRITRQPSFRQLLKSPHGLAQSKELAGTFLGQRVVTDDHKVHLAPTVLVDSLPRVRAAFENELTQSHGYRLITRRAVTTHNSWTHNLEDFATGKRITNRLYMHSEDAKELGLGRGDFADVSTDVATVRVPVDYLDELMRGTVALPHGWGHQSALGLSVAKQTTGVNANLLAADGPDRLEPVSGMAHLTGIPVSIAPAAGAHNPHDWTGLPQ